MSYGNFAFNKLQLGREATAGTAVAATTIWRGPFASPEDGRSRTIVNENVGLAVTAERTYTSAYLARLAMPATELTFEQWPHILESSINTDADPVDNLDTSYTYEYALPIDNTPNVLKTYTIEAFNNVVSGDMREMEYCFVEEWEITGAASEAWMMTANWVGRQLSDTTPTSLSTLVAVEEALFPRTKVYIDASAGTIGTTQATGVLMGASIQCRSGWQIVPVGDGSLYFAAIKFNKPSVTFSLTMELEDAEDIVEEMRDDYEDEAVKLIRLEVDGSDAYHAANIDFAGKYDTVGPYEDADGNTTVTVDGHAVYSSTDSLFFELTVTNMLATLP